jgi:diguanylate cyclase (GGDEF)-like protein
VTACAILLVVVAIALQSLSAGQSKDRDWVVATLVTAFAALVAGQSLWRQAWRVTGAPGRGWIVLAIGCWLWSIGWIVQLGSDVSTRVDAVTTILANVGFLAMAPLFVGGAVLIRPSRRPRVDGVKLLLDTMIVFVSLVVAGWQWVVRPAIERDGTTWPVTMAVAMHLAGDGVLLMTLFVVLLRAGDRNMPRERGLLVGSLTMVLAADLLWVTAWTRSGHDATVTTAPAWILGFLAVGLAAWVGPRESYAVTSHEREPGDGREPAWRIVISYPMALLMLVLIARQAIAGERGSGVAVAVIGSLVVLGLVIARQGLTLRESQRVTRHLTEQVDCDPLTGLINHRKVHERLDRELAYARADGLPVAVAMIDVDNFKEINDRFGHQTGDRVLRSLASVLKRTCRGTDIAARYAGDEFMLVLPGLDLDDAHKVGQRFLVEIAGAHERLTPGSDVTVTVSIGLAVSRGYNRASRQLIAIADAAMYDAKAAGKNRLKIVDADHLQGQLTPMGRRDTLLTRSDPITATR